jgi:arsenate reductase
VVVGPLSIKFLAEYQISTDSLCSQSLDQVEDFNANAIPTRCDSAAKEAYPVWFDQSVQCKGLSDPSKSGFDDADRRTLINKTNTILARRVKALLEVNCASLSVTATTYNYLQLPTTTYNYPHSPKLQPELIKLYLLKNGRQ